MLRLATVLLVAFVLATAPAAAGGGAAPPAQAGKAEKAKPRKAKKVWTNDDLDRLRNTVPVSTLGASPARAQAAGEAAAGGPEKAGAPEALPKEKDPEWYRQQMGSLRAELERTEKEISRLRSFLANPSTGQAGLALNKENDSLSPANQIELLQRRRDEVKHQMDDLEDQARRNGISPGALR